MNQMLSQLGLILLAGFVVLVLRRSRTGGTGSPLVLRKFEVKSDGVPAVLIEGRAPGLIAWVLTLAGLDAYTALIVTDDQIRVKKAGLSGEAHSVVPTAAVSSTNCGYSQPIWLLGLAGFIVLVSLVYALKTHSTAVMLAGLVVSITCVLMYVYHRKIEISLETSGGTVVGIAFRPSIVEGVHVNLQKALHAIARINGIVIARSRVQKV